MVQIKHEHTAQRDNYGNSVKYEPSRQYFSKKPRFDPLRLRVCFLGFFFNLAQ